MTDDTIEPASTTPTKPKPPARKANVRRESTTKRRAPVGKRQTNSVDVAEFKTWIDTLDTGAPIVHVNGQHFMNCVLTVDFGQPLIRTNKLTSEQSSEFVTRLRKLTRDVMGREVNVRVSKDEETGVWWTTAS